MTVKLKWVFKVSAKVKAKPLRILHGSKVSRESDLCRVPYNRPVGVRSFVKNMKSLSENQRNS